MHVEPLSNVASAPVDRPRHTFNLERWLHARQPPRHRYPLALLAIAIATSISLVLFHYVDLANLVMVYLLAVVIVATRLGKGPATVTSIGGVAMFVYLFVPHYNSFVLADLEYLPTFTTLFVVSMVLATLTSRLRSQILATQTREAQSLALYELSGELAAAESRGAVANVATRHIARTFACEAELLELRPGGWQLCRDLDAPLPLPDLRIALLAEQQRRALRAEPVIAQPLIVTSDVVGMLCLHTESGALRTPDDQQLLASFAHNIAVALHRVVVEEQARAAQHHIDQERMRNTMLSSVSHDLRTPLASITGSITTLIESEAQLDPGSRRELMASIHTNAEALERQLRNMLDVTRLESGTLRALREWHPLEEVVGCALTRLERLLGNRTVQIAIPTDFPLISVDALLLEQLLVNLLENAIRYANAEDPIEIAANHRGDAVTLTVSDRGPGVAETDRDHVFTKFYRGADSHGHHGAGLGLAICRAIAELHGGTISVTDNPGGGARFVVALPTGGTPPRTPPDAERVIAP